MNHQTNVVKASLHTYEEAVAWIHSLVSSGIKPGLKRMEYLMEAFGHPQRRLKFIHVAGTNGKGSTCAMLTKVLKKSGYHVGTFTSPYLEKFTNRIQVSEQDIPEAEVLRIANEIKPIAEQLADTKWGHPSMFEVVTAMAILYFAKTEYPDYVVWETGLGGRLDSTNIVVPILTIITSIGHDHMEFLGDTIEAIAAEKAGIIKAGVPVVSTVMQPEALKVIEQTALEKSATLYVLGRQFTVQASGNNDQSAMQTLDFKGLYRELPGIPLSLAGDYQIRNAGAALMAIEVLRQYMALIVDDEVLYEAFNEVKWPGRMELIQAHPRLLLDGAHNPEGAEALVEAIKNQYTYQKLHFMVGMLAAKHHKDYFRHILPIVDSIIITEPDFRNSNAAENLAEKVNECIKDLLGDTVHSPIRIIVEPDWKLALEQLKDHTAEDDLAVVSGSLYLISDVRSRVLGHSESEKGW